MKWFVILSFLQTGLMADPIYVRPIPVFTVLATPEQLHGKKVSLTGYLYCDPECLCVFADFESLKLKNYANSVWLYSSKDKDFAKSKTKLSGQRVSLLGIVDAKSHGHWGMFNVSVNVEILSVIDK